MAASEANPSSVHAPRRFVSEAEQYSNVVAGADIESIRADGRPGVSEVLSVTRERLSFTATKVGFETYSTAVVDDATVIIVYIRKAPAGSRWCDIDLEPHSILVYAPGVEHVARNPRGLDFMFASTTWDQLVRHSDDIGTPLGKLGRGEIRVLKPRSSADPLPMAFPTFAESLTTFESASRAAEDDVLRSMVHALSDDDRSITNRSRNRIDSCHVTTTCIDYAHAVQRIPSISELCLVAHVSERRLRKAFSDVFSLPPTRFFRAWALEQAHRSLLHGEPGLRTVTDVATSLGFEHLGRFAGQYKTHFGETPSSTLCAHELQIL